MGFLSAKPLIAESLQPDKRLFNLNAISLLRMNTYGLMFGRQLAIQSQRDIISLQENSHAAQC